MPIHNPEHSVILILQLSVLPYFGSNCVLSNTVLYGTNKNSPKFHGPRRFKMVLNDSICTLISVQPIVKTIKVCSLNFFFLSLAFRSDLSMAFPCSFHASNLQDCKWIVERTPDRQSCQHFVQGTQTMPRSRKPHSDGQGRNEKSTPKMYHHNKLLYTDINIPSVYHTMVP